ncbi:MAG: tetratricopeptide repeat protein, partial [Armatimonadota bacterium]
QARQLIARMEEDDADGASLGFALYRLAEALREAGEHDEALPLYEKALRVAPEAESAPYARVGAGWCRLETDPSAALQDFRAVVTDSPDSGAVSGALDGMIAAAQKLFEGEDYAAAAEIYAQIIEDFPESDTVGQAQYGRAWALLRQERDDEALPLFRAAAESVTSPAVVADARYQAARLLFDQEKYDEAVSLLEPLREAEGDAERLPWALALLGRSYLQAGSAEQAAEVLEQVLARWPEHQAASRASLDLGRAYRSLQRYDEAVEPLQRAAEADDASIAARAQHELAATARDSGDVAKAAEEFLRVAILYPDSDWAAAAQFAAGQCYEQLDQTDNAIKSYTVILRQYGDQQQWAQKAQERIDQLQ